MKPTLYFCDECGFETHSLVQIEGILYCKSCEEIKNTKDKMKEIDWD